MSEKRVSDVLKEAFEEAKKQGNVLIKPEEVVKSIHINTAPIFNAFSDLVFYPLGKALNHLEKRIDDLEKRLPAPLL